MGYILLILFFRCRQSLEPHYEVLNCNTFIMISGYTEYCARAVNLNNHLSRCLPLKKNCRASPLIMSNFTKVGSYQSLDSQFASTTFISMSSDFVLSLKDFIAGSEARSWNPFNFSRAALKAVFIRSRRWTLIIRCL